MKYRKKPVEIEAFRLGYNDFPYWFTNAITDTSVFVFSDGSARIMTLEGVLHAFKGDYIIRGVKGELYPCRADIFEMTYEVVAGHD